MCIKSGDDGKRMMMMSFRVNPLTLIRLPAARKLARAKESVRRSSKNKRRRSVCGNNSEIRP